MHSRWVHSLPWSAGSWSLLFRYAQQNEDPSAGKALVDGATFGKVHLIIEQRGHPETSPGLFIGSLVDLCARTCVPLHCLDVRAIQLTLDCRHPDIWYVACAITEFLLTLVDPGGHGDQCGHSSERLNESLNRTMAAPGPTGANSAMNTQDLGYWVRNWVHYDNLATNLYRQTTNARRVRDEFEGKILESLRANQMENAIIQIAGGRLLVQEEKHAAPFTLARLEELLHDYHKQKGGGDETDSILKYVRKHRAYEITKKLKKQSGNVAPLPPPPAAPGLLPPPAGHRG